MNATAEIEDATDFPPESGTRCYDGMNIYQRILAVMQEVSYIQREWKEGLRYSVTSHDAVTAKLRGPMIKWGIVYHPTELSIVQNGTRTEAMMVVRFVNVDDLHQFVDVPSCGYGLDNQDKGPGKAISYSVKYALLKTFGLETGDDPDFDQTTEHVPATITDEQHANLKALLDEVGVTDEQHAKFLTWLETDTLANLSGDKYSKAVDFLEKKR